MPYFAAVVAAACATAATIAAAPSSSSAAVVEKWAGRLSMDRVGIAHDVPLNLTVTLPSPGATEGTAVAEWTFDHNNAGASADAHLFVCVSDTKYSG